jgi:hypothetical protein
MSKDPTKKQSFKDLVEDAKDIGVSPDEVRRIQKVVKSHRFPADVQAVEMNFGRDWTGAPAAWIEFLVESDLNPSDHKITRLNELVNQVRRDLLRTKPVYWPYVGFRAAS